MTWGWGLSVRLAPARPGAPAAPAAHPQAEALAFSHGLNERTPIAAIRPAIGYYLSLILELSKWLA